MYLSSISLISLAVYTSERIDNTTFGVDVEWLTASVKTYTNPLTSYKGVIILNLNDVGMNTSILDTSVNMHRNHSCNCKCSGSSANKYHQ